MLIDFDLLPVKFILNFLHSNFDSVTVTRIYKLDQTCHTLVLLPGGSCCFSVTFVANDRNGSALLLCVFKVLCFALVADSIIATKNTKHLFNKTGSPVGYNVIVAYYFLRATCDKTIDLNPF
jgi:hypothetical protein